MKPTYEQLEQRVQELEMDFKYEHACTAITIKYHALRDAGNDLAKCLQRALVDIEDWGCKTKREREVLKAWKELTKEPQGAAPDFIGDDPSQAMTHSEEPKEPVLLSYTCVRCGYRTSNAHDMTRCPWKTGEYLHLLRGTGKEPKE